MADEPPDRARIEPPAARGEEKCVHRAAREHGPTLPEVAGEVVRGLLPEWDDTLLAALATDVQCLALEVDVGEVEPHGLGGSQSSGVEDLEQRPIAERERRIAVCELQQRFDLGGLRRIREAARLAGRERSVGNACRAEGEAKTRADRREPARDRRGRKSPPSAAELRYVVGEDTRVDVVQPEPAILEPHGERAQVRAVRATCRIREPSALEEAVDGRVGVHGVEFGLRRAGPAASHVRCGQLANSESRPYSERMTVQIPVRIPERDAELLDEAVARGRFASRSEALREGLALLLREEREREIEEAYRRAYEKYPQEDWIGEVGLWALAQIVGAEEAGREPL